MIDHRGLLSLDPFTKGLELTALKGKRLPRYLFCARRLSRYYAQRVKGPEDRPSLEDTQTLGFSNYIPGLGGDMPFHVVYVPDLRNRDIFLAILSKIKLFTDSTTFLQIVKR